MVEGPSKLSSPKILNFTNSPFYCVFRQIRHFITFFCHVRHFIAFFAINYPFFVGLANSRQGVASLSFNPKSAFQTKRQQTAASYGQK